MGATEVSDEDTKSKGRPDTRLESSEWIEAGLGWQEVLWRKGRNASPFLPYPGGKMGMFRGTTGMFRCDAGMFLGNAGMFSLKTDMFLLKTNNFLLTTDIFPINTDMFLNNVFMFL